MNAACMLIERLKRLEEFQDQDLSLVGNTKRSPVLLPDSQLSPDRKPEPIMRNLAVPGGTGRGEFITRNESPKEMLKNWKMPEQPSPSLPQEPGVARISPSQDELQQLINSSPKSPVY